MPKAKITFPTEEEALAYVDRLIANHGIWPGAYHSREGDYWYLTFDPGLL